MKIGFIIQSRMSSTRLPNKMAMPFGNEPSLLGHTIERLKSNFQAYTISVATSINEKDDEIVGVGGWNENLDSSQEYDLLMRLYNVGAKFKRLDNCKTIIRQRKNGQISQGNKKLLWENYTNLRVRFYNNSIKPLKDIALEKRALFCVFGAIQILHQYNPSLALQIHNTILKSSNFKPATKTIRSKLYLLI